MRINSPQAFEREIMTKFVILFSLITVFVFPSFIFAHPTSGEISCRIKILNNPRLYSASKKTKTDAYNIARNECKSENHDNTSCDFNIGCSSNTDQNQAKFACRLDFDKSQQATTDEFQQLDIDEVPQISAEELQRLKALKGFGKTEKSARSDLIWHCLEKNNWSNCSQNTFCSGER